MEMTQEWITQFNKKCAEFMSYKLITPDKRKHPDEWKHSYWEHKDKANVHTSKKVLGRDGYLSFHSDWNWIMEVVEKIVQCYEDECDTLSEMHVMNLPIHTPKQYVIHQIDQFIDWYNKQKEL